MEYLFDLILNTLFCRETYETIHALNLMYNVAILMDVNATIPIFIVLNAMLNNRTLCLLYLLFYYYMF